MTIDIAPEDVILLLDLVAHQAQVAREMMDVEPDRATRAAWQARAETFERIARVLTK